jgi:hypothetical protein
VNDLGSGGYSPGLRVNSLFCRHNRFTADCPICSKGTVLDSERPRAARQPRPASRDARGRRAPAPQRAAARYTGPYASAGPYEDESGNHYEVRLERVPGGVRLAEWAGGQIRRRAPVLSGSGLGGMLAAARERSLLGEPDIEALEAAVSGPPGTPVAGEPSFGASRGRSGDMQEELRVEGLENGELRVGRWILRPGAGWELQQAPVMLPAARYAEALRTAAARGVLGAGS